MKTIPLTRGQTTLVDDSDFEEVNKWKWHANKNKENGWYAARWHKEKNSKHYMHHEFLKGSPCVDHINCNGLDNRRENLRPCTHQENNRNRRKSPKAKVSRFKGVFKTKGGKWFASIWGGGKPTYLGIFTSELEAAKAYDKAAVESFGEYARLNFPNTHSQPK